MFVRLFFLSGTLHHSLVYLWLASDCHIICASRKPSNKYDQSLLASLVKQISSRYTSTLYDLYIHMDIYPPTTLLIMCWIPSCCRSAFPQWTKMLCHRFPPITPITSLAILFWPFAHMIIGIPRIPVACGRSSPHHAIPPTQMRWHSLAWSRWWDPPTFHHSQTWDRSRSHGPNVCYMWVRGRAAQCMWEQQEEEKL